MQEKASLLPFSQQEPSSESPSSPKALKITNPLFLGQIGPRIQELHKKLNIPGMTYETLYAYFVHIVQAGGDMMEFWVAYHDNEPGAFACWYMRGLPYIGTVSLDMAYSWTPMKGLFSLLVDEFIKFGPKHRCNIYDGSTFNLKLFKQFQKLAEKKNLQFIDTSMKTFKAKR